MSRLAVVGASTSVRFQSVARCHTTTLRVLLTVENLHDLIYTILPQFTWLWYLKSSSIFVINKSKDEMKTSGNLHCRHGRSVTKCLVSSPPALEICLCGVSREVMVMLFSGLLLRNLEQVTIIQKPYSFIYPYCAHVYIKFLYSNPVFGWDLQEGLVSPRLWWYPGLREGTEGVSITTNVMVPDIYSTIYLTCTLKMIFAMMHA